MPQIIITKGSYKKEPICDELACHSYNVWNIILWQSNRANLSKMLGIFCQNYNVSRITQKQKPVMYGSLQEEKCTLLEIDLH